MVGWLGLACMTTWACLFQVRPGVLSKTLSPMWVKLNLPIFLFKMGLFTLINIDSLIFLAKLCPSLPIIWKFCWVVGWPMLLLWVMYGGRILLVFFEYFSKGPVGSPMYSSLQVRLPPGTSICPQFCWPWGLCPWGRPVGFWWCYYLWSGFVYHTSHKSFKCFHRVSGCMV